MVPLWSFDGLAIYGIWGNHNQVFLVESLVTSAILQTTVNTVNVIASDRERREWLPATGRKFIPRVPRTVQG